MKPGTQIALVLLLLALGACAHGADSSGTQNAEKMIADLLTKAKGQSQALLLALSPIMQKVRTMIPREKLNISLSSGALDVKALQSYGIGIAKVAGGGVGIGLIGGIVAIFYVPIRCCCACRRQKKLPKEYSLNIIVRTLSFVLVVSVLVLFGSAVAFSGNQRFSGALNLLGQITFGAADEVVGIGNGTVAFVDGIVPKMRTLFDAGTALLDKIPNATAPCDTISVDLTNARNVLSETASRIQSLKGTNQQITDLKQRVSTSLTNADSSITQVNDLITKARDELQNMANQSKEKGNQTIADAINMTANVRTTVAGITNKISTYVVQVHEYGGMVLGYDRYRLSAIMGLLAIPFLVMFLEYFGFFLKQSWAILISIGFGFLVFSVLLLLGGLHLVIGMALGDACDMVKTIQLPGQVDNILTSCKGGNTIFDALNMSMPLNSSAMVPTAQIDDFTQFANGTLNIAQMKVYINAIDNLTAFDISVNQSEAANAMGYNFTDPQAEVDKLLSQFNNVCTANCVAPQCAGVVYSESNFSACNVTWYAASAQTNISNLKDAVAKAVDAKTLIAQFIQNVTDIQALLRSLNSSAQSALGHYGDFNRSVTHFIDVDFETLRVAVSNFTRFIDSFTAIGNCKFLTDAVDAINATTCQTMLSCVDLLAMGFSAAGLFSLPIIIADECLIKMSKKKSKKLDEENKSAPAHGAVHPEKIIVAAREDLNSAGSAYSDDSEKGLING